MHLKNNVLCVNMKYKICIISKFMLVEFSYKSYFITTATQITAKAFSYMVIGTPPFKSSSRENFFCEQMFCPQKFFVKTAAEGRSKPELENLEPRT